MSNYYDPPIPTEQYYPPPPGPPPPALPPRTPSYPATNSSPYESYSPYASISSHHDLATPNPRSVSQTSLCPPYHTIEGSKRELLLIYIHGFLGSEISFQSFPAHLHNTLSHLITSHPTLSSTYFVHTKVYPKFKTRHPIHVATAQFSAWLTQFEGPMTDVVLLGHSMGGILAAEVVLLRGEDMRRRHDVLGVVAFDTPFLGMHPGVIGAGLGSIFKPQPKKREPTEEEKEEERIQAEAEFGPLPKRNFTDGKGRGKEQQPWAGALHFITKYHDHLTQATGKYLMSHLEFGACLADPPEMLNRYRALRALEQGIWREEYQALERVRFVNYYTVSFGREKEKKVEPAPPPPEKLEGVERDILIIDDGGSDRLLEDGLSTMDTGSTTSLVVDSATGHMEYESTAASSFTNLAAVPSQTSSISTGSQSSLHHPSPQPAIPATPSSPTPAELVDQKRLAYAAEVERTRLALEKLTHSTPGAFPDSDNESELGEMTHLAPEPDYDSNHHSDHHSNSIDDFGSAPSHSPPPIPSLSPHNQTPYTASPDLTTPSTIIPIPPNFSPHPATYPPPPGSPPLLSPELPLDPAAIKKQQKAELKASLAAEKAHQKQLAAAEKAARKASEKAAKHEAKLSAKRNKKPRERKFCITPSGLEKEKDDEKVWRKVEMKGVDEVGAHCGLFFVGDVYKGLIEGCAGTIKGWVEERGVQREVEEAARAAGQ